MFFTGFEIEKKTISSPCPVLRPAVLVIGDGINSLYVVMKLHSIG